ncbi:hypothetical protein V6N13_071937 [Hibiscus sabdariffa]
MDDPPNVQQHLLEKPFNIAQDSKSIPSTSDLPLGRSIPIDFNAVTDDSSHDLSGTRAMAIVKSKGFSRGIWIAWYDTISIEVLLNHFQFVHYRVVNKRDGKFVLAIVVYANLNLFNKKLLWLHLRHLATSIRSPWILFGDFNATLNTLE